MVKNNQEYIEQCRDILGLLIPYLHKQTQQAKIMNVVLNQILYHLKTILVLW